MQIEIQYIGVWLARFHGSRFGCLRPERDGSAVIVLLSVKAGLRAGEIANLTWEMILDPRGEVGTVIELRDHAAKKQSGRLIPIHGNLRRALIEWRSMTASTGMRTSLK